MREIPRFRIVKKTFVPFGRHDLTFSTTLKAVADAFDLNLIQIKLHCRKQKYALPRQIAVYLANKLTKQSLSSIGIYLGMDHTTMIHARNKVKRLISTDDMIRHRVFQIEEVLVAAFARTTLPAIGQSLLGGEKEQQDGNPWPDAIPAIPSVDS